MLYISLSAVLQLKLSNGDMLYFNLVYFYVLLNFLENSALASSKIVDKNQGKIQIKAVSIDEMLAGERASFIKMDIEGAEMPALIGAQKTIEKYKPKLAISIYHKEDDLWEIPYYILDKN